MTTNEKAVTIYSHDSESGNYKLDVYDPKTWFNMKSKTFLSADITGTPILSVQEEMKTVMLRDDNGLLTFLRIKTTDLVQIVIDEVLIE